MNMGREARAKILEIIVSLTMLVMVLLVAIDVLYKQVPVEIKVDGRTVRVARELKSSQKLMLSQLGKSGAVSSQTLKLAEKVGEKATKFASELVKTPEGREKAIKHVRVMSELVRKSSAEELRDILLAGQEKIIAENTAKAKKDFDLQHSRISSITKVKEKGKIVMIVTLVDRYGKKMDIKITDPKEQRDYEAIYKLYESAKKNPVLKIMLDIANFYLQKAIEKTEKMPPIVKPRKDVRKRNGNEKKK